MLSQNTGTYVDSDGVVHGEVMAITKGSFQGHCYPVGSDALELLQNTVGAVASQASIVRGGDKKMQGPGHDPIDPRRLFGVHIGNERLGVIPSGSELHANEAATGKHQPEKELITGDKAPQSTGAGEGLEHVLTYKPVAQGSSTRVDRQQQRPGEGRSGQTS